MKTYKVTRVIVKGIDTVTEKGTLKSGLTLTQAEAYLASIKKRAKTSPKFDGVFQSGRQVQVHTEDKMYIFRIR